jgi:hypothetical protein
VTQGDALDAVTASDVTVYLPARMIGTGQI